MAYRSTADASAARPVGSAKNSAKHWAAIISARKSKPRCVQAQIARSFSSERLKHIPVRIAVDALIVAEQR